MSWQTSYLAARRSEWGRDRGAALELRAGVIPRESSGLESRLDRGTVGLQEGRQREPLAEVLGVLVGGEAGSVGGDLEEDAARLAEVERLEVVAVDDVGDADAGRPYPVSPGAVLGIVRSAESDVMDSAAAELGGAEIRPLLDANFRAGTTWTALEDDRAQRGIVHRGIVAGLAEIKDIGEHPRGRTETVNGQGDMIEPANLVFFRDRTSSPGSNPSSLPPATRAKRCPSGR